MDPSTRARYAVTAMADLAGRAPGTPVTLAQIAASQQLSQCYLEQLFGGLRRAGLVISARGPGGGYRLARPAEAMAVAEIIGAVDEPICTADTGTLWAELAQHITLFLAGITLADVVQGRVAGRAAPPSPPRMAEAAE